MLNRDKTVQALTSLSSRLFFDDANDRVRVRALWQCIAEDVTLSLRLRTIEAPFAVPEWEGALMHTVVIHRAQHYTVLALDGSQIYPDRHMPGGSCFLINVGGVHFTYGSQSRVQMICEPHVFLPEDICPDDDMPFSIDVVDLLREAYEFKKGVECITTSPVPLDLVLFDGSLIFWHLESLQPTMRDRFLGQYLMSLMQFYEKRALIAGYLSLPRNRDIAHIVQLATCERVHDGIMLTHATNDHCQCHIAGDTLDSTIAGFFLTPGQRTTIFKSTAKITERYPLFLKPHFFYLDVGQEIARVEIPAWIASDPLLVERVCAIILDQAAKGNGYPVSLAEAHEQAVVKGADRDFFYHVLCKMGIMHNKKPIMSQKNLKKRGLGI